ncbi:uncharacterized protein N7515_000389 [Penicillium bovifimosum]|uniref:Uncharacterized protein n=1 Tax=Penicillium bovifimosum TaxID=126998 RepID=A0A9W9LBE1_9EURO|nr:uncharacterized protein N7515_000389 [Penicillium bovifimosum]KAJ5145825.1 hypothetical protein N7515_000389 [Penicillium bovifimosum]
MVLSNSRKHSAGTTFAGFTFVTGMLLSSRPAEKPTAAFVSRLCEAISAPAYQGHIVYCLQDSHMVASRRKESVTLSPQLAEVNRRGHDLNVVWCAHTTPRPSLACNANSISISVYAARLLLVVGIFYTNFNEEDFIGCFRFTADILDYKNSSEQGKSYIRNIWANIATKIKF